MPSSLRTGNLPPDGSKVRFGTRNSPPGAAAPRRARANLPRRGGNSGVRTANLPVEVATVALGVSTPTDRSGNCPGGGQCRRFAGQCRHSGTRCRRVARQCRHREDLRRPSPVLEAGRRTRGRGAARGRRSLRGEAPCSTAGFGLAAQAPTPPRSRSRVLAGVLPNQSRHARLNELCSRYPSM